MESVSQSLFHKALVASYCLLCQICPNLFSLPLKQSQNSNSLFSPLKTLYSSLEISLPSKMYFWEEEQWTNIYWDPLIIWEKFLEICFSVSVHHLGVCVTPFLTHSGNALELRLGQMVPHLILPIVCLKPLKYIPSSELSNIQGWCNQPPSGTYSPCSFIVFRVHEAILSTSSPLWSFPEMANCLRTWCWHGHFSLCSYSQVIVLALWYQSLLEERGGVLSLICLIVFVKEPPCNS